MCTLNLRESGRIAHACHAAGQEVGEAPRGYCPPGGRSSIATHVISLQHSFCRHLAVFSVGLASQRLYRVGLGCSFRLDKVFAMGKQATVMPSSDDPFNAQSVRLAEATRVSKCLHAFKNQRWCLLPPCACTFCGNLQVRLILPGLAKDLIEDECVRGKAIKGHKSECPACSHADLRLLPSRQTTPSPIPRPAGEAARKAAKKLSKLHGIVTQAGGSDSGVVVDLEVMEAEYKVPEPPATKEKADRTGECRPTPARIKAALPDPLRGRATSAHAHCRITA